MKVVSELNDAPPSKEDQEAAFILADTDQSGGIDFEEFTALCVYPPPPEQRTPRASTPDPSTHLI